MAKRRNLDSKYREMLDEAERGLIAAIPGLVWYFEGPHGASPEPEQLQKVRETLTKIILFKQGMAFE